METITSGMAGNNKPFLTQDMGETEIPGRWKGAVEISLSSLYSFLLPWAPSDGHARDAGPDWDGYHNIQKEMSFLFLRWGEERLTLQREDKSVSSEEWSGGFSAISDGRASRDSFNF